MPIIEFTQEDINRSKIVEPAWYRCKITGVEPKLSSKGDSTNYWIKGTILFNADSGSKDFADVPTPMFWMFNSKAMGNAVGFFNALGVEVKPGTRLEMDNAVGQELDVFIGNGLYNNQPINEIQHRYRKPKVAE